MEEWKEYKLGDVCGLVPGFAFKSKDFGTGSNMVVKIKDIQPPYVEIQNADTVDISNYDIKKLSKFVVRRGEFLLAMTGATIGKIGKYLDNTPSYVNQRVLKFSDIGLVSYDYLYYYLSTDHFHSFINNHIDSESAQPNISANTIGKYIIKVPSPVIQKRIASILKSLDDKIEVNRRINENLEQQAQALFKSWFVDFEPFKDGEFVESELGMIPKGWRVGTLEEIGDVIGGSTPSKARSDYYTENGIAWLTPKDLSVSNAKFTAKGEIDITQEGYNSCSTKLMPKGTVLFSSRAPIGYITIAKNNICTNQGFKSVVPGYAGTAFIYCYLKTATPDIENKATGSTFKEASGSLMKSLQLVVAPKDIMNSFEERLKPIFDEQKCIEDESRRLSEIRDTLLPKLMSGELKVTNMDLVNEMLEKGIR